MKSIFLFIFASIILFSVSGCFKKVPERELNQIAVSAMEKTISINSTAHAKHTFIVVLGENISPIGRSFLIREEKKGFLIRIFTERNITEGNKISGKDLRVLKFRTSSVSNESDVVIY